MAVRWLRMFAVLVLLSFVILGIHVDFAQAQAGGITITAMSGGCNYVDVTYFTLDNRGAVTLIVNKVDPTGETTIDNGTGRASMRGTTASAYFPPVPSGTQLHVIAIWHDAMWSTIFGRDEDYVVTTCVPVSPSAGGGDAPFDPGDDRLNPHPYAPIAVYCREGNVVVYAIDPQTAQGLFAFASDDGSASGLGATLLTLEDGRLAALAHQADGKLYIFVFDGCPNQRSETYVSDPVTGLPVMTERRE